MRTTCKHCHKSFKPIRAGAQYCSGACRVAAHRKRQVPPPPPLWIGTVPDLSLSNDELGEHLVEIARQGDGGKPKTGRRFYYLALSYGYIQPDMSATDAGKKSRASAYQRITRILGVLRKQGRLGWDDVLDLTRELDEWQTYTSPREARAALRRSYSEDRWLGQPVYPTLIVEKDTLEPVCKPMARGWQMPFASSRGYGSLTLQHDVAAMLKTREAKTGQTLIVLFISDLDPSGLDLQRSWEQALDDFNVVYVLERIALTLEQAQAVPNVLLRQGIEVKRSDSRSASYIAEYGERCWEVDVLPGSVIEQAIDAQIDSWLDVRLWNQRNAEIERGRALL